MLLGQYIKWFAVFFATLLVTDQIPPIKTIDAGPSEASQLLLAVSEFANGVKDNIVELVSQPSNSSHEKGHNQTLQDPAPLPPQVEPPLELPQEPPLPPEIPPLANSTLRFWRKEGTKIILELDLEWIPWFGVLEAIFGRVAYWFGVLLSSNSESDLGGKVYWVYFVVPAAVGFFGGLGCGLRGRHRRWPLRGKPPKTVEEVEPAVEVKKVARKPPAKAYFESRLSESYMMPSTFQHGLDPRRLKLSAAMAATKPEHLDINSTIDRIAKKEEDGNPLVVPQSFSDSSWYSPGSPLSPTQVNGSGFEMPSLDGFQPKLTASRLNDPIYSLLGTPPLAPPPQNPDKPNLPQISDPWSNYIPDDREELS